MKNLIFILFLALGIQTQAQTIIPVQNAPFCPATHLDGSKIVLTAVELGNATVFTWTSPFPAGTPTWYAGIGLEFLGSKSGTCPYVYNDVPLSDNMTTAAYDPSCWDVPIWYKNTPTPAVTYMTIPWNAYPAPTSDCHDCYAQAGGAIISDALSHHYYLDLFTMVGSTMYKCKVVFDYTAPFIEHAPCGPTAVAEAAPAAPVVKKKGKQ